MLLEAISFHVVRNPGAKNSDFIREDTTKVHRSFRTEGLTRGTEVSKSFSIHPDIAAAYVSAVNGSRKSWKKVSKASNAKSICPTWPHAAIMHSGMADAISPSCTMTRSQVVAVSQPEKELIIACSLVSQEMHCKAPFCLLYPHRHFCEYQDNVSAAFWLNIDIADTMNIYGIRGKLLCARWMKGTIKWRLSCTQEGYRPICSCKHINRLIEYLL